MAFRITKVTGNDEPPHEIPDGGETSNPAPNFYGTALQPDEDINIFCSYSSPPQDLHVGGTTSNADGSWMVPLMVQLASRQYVFYARVGRDGLKSDNNWTITMLPSTK